MITRRARRSRGARRDGGCWASNGANAPPVRTTSVSLSFDLTIVLDVGSILTPQVPDFLRKARISTDKSTQGGLIELGFQRGRARAHQPGLSRASRAPSPAPRPPTSPLSPRALHSWLQVKVSSVECGDSGLGLRL